MEGYEQNGNLCSDHGSPIWPNYYFYGNTVLQGPAPWRAHYAHGFGARGTNGNRRGVFNNIFLTMDGLPGMVITAEKDYQMDGNLHWGAKEGAKFDGDFFKKFRHSKLFEESKQWYAPGWTTNDLFADPKFTALETEWQATSDLTLQKGSPAIDAGVAVPAEWPDPLRAADAGKPDIGAVPAGSKAPRVGVNGRYSIFGGK